ncbi:MAG: glycosyltransferase, partial [Candidatus Omnitrophota bacterium]|nr:glycosyltransferase [Candidatus Omnitrophota bacterium]
VRPTFVESIIKAFQNDPNIVLHMDEVRNNSMRFYPFNYPSIEDITGEGCVNWVDGQTTGLIDEEDPIHSRNYGACMAAFRDDLINIGGADEHIDYLGHVCGPYEMTFRLRSFGRKEVWHRSEFLYHVRHPGQAGDKNYVGPHDGSLFSTTALAALRSGRIAPLVENQAIKALRRADMFDKFGENELRAKLIDPSYLNRFSYHALANGKKLQMWYDHEMIMDHKEYNIIRYRGKVYGVPKNLELTDLNKEEPDNHPTIITADEPDAIIKQINRFGPDEINPKLAGEYKGHNIVKYGRRVYGIAKNLGSIDLMRQDTRRTVSHLSGADEKEVQGLIDRLTESVAVEYAGWLPTFRHFGNCGRHPQFAHIEVPPEGYRFILSDEQSKRSLGGGRLRLFPLGRLLKIIIAAVKFAWSARLKGAKLRHIFCFLLTRDIRSQLLLDPGQKLIFLPSVPYTFNQYRWVIELEDSTSFMFPFLHNGDTVSVDVRNSPYFLIFKTLIESEQCAGIITHMESTSRTLPILFENKTLFSKITYAPVGVKLPADCHDFGKEGKRINILFTNSWHQDSKSFFTRGGQEVLSAFKELRKKYPDVFLTLRTALPVFHPRYTRIIEQNDVRVIDWFLSDEEMESLLLESDIYVLPSSRIHAVSTLKAMSYGLPVVVSDGWGVEEYVEDGKNGMVVRGRYGKVTWMEEETGILREKYDLTFNEDPVIINGLIEALSDLIESKDLRERIGRQARHDVETKYNLDNWNMALKAAFDKALGKRGVT